MSFDHLEIDMEIGQFGDGSACRFIDPAHQRCTQQPCAQIKRQVAQDFTRQVRIELRCNVLQQPFWQNRFVLRGAQINTSGCKETERQGPTTRQCISSSS